MNRRFSIFALLTAFVFLCFLTGCWNPFAPDKDKNGGGGGQQELLARTSPENVLHNLRVIYAEKDNLVNTNEDAHFWAENYRTLFHPDFIFYFSPKDVIPNFPEGWWGLNDEVPGFENMLKLRASGVLDDIQLTWLVSPSEPDPRVGHESWRMIIVNGILLDVIEGETTHRASDGSAEFYFLADPADSTLWVIGEWKDIPAPSGV